MVVSFNNYVCKIAFNKYRNNNRVCVQLLDLEDSCPVATATVNVPDEILAEDEIIIKNYSENEGIYDVLLNAGLISSGIRILPLGYEYGIVCKLLVKPTND